MKDFMNGVMFTASILAVTISVMLMTGHLKIYGIGMFGVGRLFCFQGP